MTTQQLQYAYWQRMRQQQLYKIYAAGGSNQQPPSPPPPPPPPPPSKPYAFQLDQSTGDLTIIGDELDVNNVVVDEELDADGNLYIQTT